MNSMLHSVMASLASLEMAMSLGKISLTIFCTVAFGNDKSSPGVDDVGAKSDISQVICVAVAFFFLKTVNLGAIYLTEASEKMRRRPSLYTHSVLNADYVIACSCSSRKRHRIHFKIRVAWGKWYSAILLLISLFKFLFEKPCLLLFPGVFVQYSSAMRVEVL